MFIIKLGGSAITDKSKKYSYKKEIMSRLSTEIKKSNKEIILIHGAGSFGHILAEEYDLNSGYKNDKHFKVSHLLMQWFKN